MARKNADPLDYGLELSSPDELVAGQTNCVIYGAPGSGKSSLAATAPTPLILDFEKGAAASVRAVGAEDARIIQVTEMEQVRNAYSYLATGKHGFKTVVLDPVGELMRMCLNSVVGKYSSRRQYDDLPSMADWNKSLSDMIKLLTAFRSLPIHCVVTAHASIPEHEEDTVKPLVSGRQFGPFLEGAMDLLAYIHMEQDSKGNSVRRLITEPTPTIRAKNRGSKLPPVIEEPNLNEIFALMES